MLTHTRDSFESVVQASLPAVASRHRVETIAVLRHADRSWPLLCVSSSPWVDSRPAVLVSGGLHGDEQAGVHAALRFLGDDCFAIHDAVNFVVLPCVNPSGFDAETLASESGANLNRLFGTGSSEPEIRAIEDWLADRRLRFRMTFDLHEVRAQYVGEGFAEADNPRGAYLYELASDDSERIGRAMIDAIAAERQVCTWPTIYGDVNDRGVVSYPQDCHNPVYACGTSFDAFLRAHYTGHAFTLETPAGWALHDRVDTHLTWLTIALQRLASS